ncbi:hypothetical protein HFN86_09075 [Rhizobium laguerreae]|nr:hypothetical protein [Rhizobium laguerreae]
MKHNARQPFPSTSPIFVKVVHRQIGVLLHTLTDDEPDSVLARQHKLAANIADCGFDIECD